MDEFEVLTTLYTPGSDLVLGDVTDADAETSFGRAGNDLLRTYSPQAIADSGQNLDFLFGDIFDNSQEEVDVVFGIQDGTNPLGILDLGPPSVGADRFILGDVNAPYYDDDISGATGNDPFNNFFGLNDYSVIYDFNPEQDTIQLHGSPEDYLLVEIDNLPVEGISQPFSGEAVFQLKEDKLDLVTYVISTPEVELDLNDDNFEYIDGASQPSLEQAGQFGSPGVDVSYGSATDSEGNVYLTGTTSGSLEGEAQGGFDVWVTKHDRQGQELWRQQFGTSGKDRAYGIEVDNNDDVYLTGDTNGDLFGDRQSAGSDAWLAKLDGSNGEQIWGRQYGTDTTDGNANTSFDLAVDGEGDVYASGIAIKDSTLPPEVFNFAVEDDAFVIKFDTDGNQEWFSTLSSPVFDESYGIDVDDEGNVYATGWTQGLVEESDPNRDLLKYDYWLAQLDADNGEVESTQQFNSSDNGLEFAWDVETDSQGNAVVSGWTTGDLAGNNGSYDPFLAKYNPDATQQWIQQFGTSGDDGSYTASFDIDSEDNIYVTGYTDSNLGGDNRGEYDTWVAKYDSEGNQQWTQQLGTTEREYGTDIVANEFDEVFVTGFTNGSLGSANAGAEDAWIAKLSADSGDIENFTDDMQGGRGQIGQEPEDLVEETEDGQISEEAITDSLEDVFAPDEEFTDSFGEAINDNSDELIFEDETGEELNEEEIESIEGIEDDDSQDDEEDRIDDNEDLAIDDEEDSTDDDEDLAVDEIVDESTVEDDEEVIVADEEDSELTEDTPDEILDESTTEDGDSQDDEEDSELTEDTPDEILDESTTEGDDSQDDEQNSALDDEDTVDEIADESTAEDEDPIVADENGNTNDEQLSQEEIIDSLNDVFAPDDGEFSESLEDTFNNNSDELIIEDGTGTELSEEEIEGINDETNTQELEQ